MPFCTLQIDCPHIFRMQAYCSLHIMHKCLLCLLIDSFTLCMNANGHNAHTPPVHRVHTAAPMARQFDLDTSLQKSVGPVSLSCLLSSQWNIGAPHLATAHMSAHPSPLFMLFNLFKRKVTSIPLPPFFCDFIMLPFFPH